MLTSVRSLLAASVFATTVCLAVPAMAQEEDEGIGIEVSANVALVSDYKFRGVSLSDGDIAIQGGVDLGLPAGFYIGTWASSLDETTVGFGSTELDIYGGWAGEFGSISTDIGVITYIYPNAGAGDFDYVEFYGSVGAAIGPAEATIGIAYAPDQDSLGSTDNFYVYTDVGVGITGTPVVLTGHVGYTDGFLTYTEDSKAWDFSVGAEAALGSILTAGVAYVGVEDDRSIDPTRTFTDDSVVFTLSASF
ncbi:MAG: TorF family putative porin [Alteraurantiacibacter sp. bin_em_oilr2.035]|nr:TorF family putative porin [Aurantiacibacter atlanticus]MDF1834434.1 TorF family putative porin [Alteraurantiacibacter sp. bin_em_oilr2.035]